MLNIEFGGFVGVLKMMTDRVKQGGPNRIELVLDNIAETAELQFTQDNEFRTDVMLSLNFVESKPDLIKQSIAFRINNTHQMNMLY